MTEKIPSSPYRQRDGEKIPLSEEIKAVLGIFELTRRMRAKVPENPEDVDKSPDDSDESVGDHIAMSTYLMHYFLPLLEKEGIDLDYERTLDTVLAHDIGDIGTINGIPGVQKSPEQKRQEIIQAARTFGDLPQRGGFNRRLFDAYADYLGQETREGRFVRGINGLETMLYVLSRPDALRPQLIGEKGYAIEDYRDRIGVFCQEFPPLREFYVRMERLFHIQGYFAPSRVYENKLTRPDTMRNIFISNAPRFGNTKEVDPDTENMALLQFQRMKRQLRFGHPPKPNEEHRDSDAEHISALLFLARYFAPAVSNDPAQRDAKDISLRRTIEIILAHDAPEALTGDRIVQTKTEEDAVKERLAAISIAQEHAPRAGSYNFEFLKRYTEYEGGKTATPVPSSATLAKALDVMEGQLYIYDPETRPKLAHMRIMSRLAVDQKVGNFIRLFPILNSHYEALNKRFVDEGLF